MYDFSQAGNAVFFIENDNGLFDKGNLLQSNRHNQITRSGILKNFKNTQSNKEWPTILQEIGSANHPSDLLV